MSKKSVRVRNSFSRRWAGVISASLFFVAAHSAAAENDRPSFREFRDANAGIDRSALRRMYRTEFGGGGRSTDPASITIPTIPMPAVSTISDAVRVTGTTRRIEKRLERQGVINQSIQQVDSNLVNIRGGVSLDLTSTTRNITLGNNLFGKVSAVEITVGGETKTVQAGSQVSAAEYIAVKQILSGNSQKITIDNAGSAIGGEVDLGSITANNDVMRASDLVVPVNVTTYGDFSKRSDFKLLGDLTNAGTVHTYSSHKNGGAIRADDITNQAGALISSETDLGLFASGNLSNYGTITSKGNLTLSAGDTLTNASEVSAKRDVNLNASNILNSGSVTSLKGDINIDGPSTAELNVTANGGTFTAANAINVRNSEYAGAFNTNVTGGDFFSQELNLNAGNGVMQTHVGELTGVLNQTGSEAHVTASTDELVLGEVCLTGDPTFKNDSGNITIAGNITVNEQLAIIASGNVSSVNNITITAATAATGFPITIVAGADQLVAGTNSTTLPGGGTAQGTSLTGVASATGGSILLGNNVTISSRSTGATGAGGDVLLAAFEGGTVGSGRVNVGGGTTTINTGGRTAGDANGNVTIIAGLQNGNAVNVGFINTTGGNTSTGQINITTTQPISSNGGNIVYNLNGTIASGNSLIAGPGVGTNANVTFVRNSLTNVDVFVDADTITTLTGSSVTSNFGTINFTSVNGIIGAGVGSLVSAPTVNLVSQNTDIGSISQRVRVDANNLYVDAPLGSVYVQDIDEVNLLAATVQGDFNILAQGTLSNSGAIAGDTVTLRSSGGNINILNTITGVSGVDLRASFNVEGTAQITSPVLAVQSDLANIGSVSSLIIDVDDLRITAPNGSATLTDLNSVNLGGGDSSVFGTLKLTADFGISNTSNVTANVVDLTATNGVFTLGAGTVITGLTSINLTAGQSIQTADLGASLVSPRINLTSLLANIGTNSALPLNLDAQSVTLNAANGNVWFSDPNSVNLGPGASSALSTFEVTAANNLTSTGSVFATDVNLTATAGGFDLDGAVAGTNSIKLTSANSILNSSISGGLSNGFGGAVANLELTSTAGDIASLSNDLDIDADNLTFTASNGSAYIHDLNDVTVLGNSFAQFNIGLVVNGAFTNVGTIDSGNSTDINANSIDVQNNITAGGNITLSADTTLTTSAALTADNNINLNSNGSISTSGPVSATGDVFASANGAINTFDTVNAVGDVTLFATGGNITTFQTITAGGDATISGDSIQTLGSVSATSGSVILAANVGPANITGLVSAGVDIDISGNGVTTFNTLSAGNLVSIDSQSTLTTLGAITTNTGDVVITAVGDVNVNSSVNSGFGIFISSTGGDVDTLDVLNAVDLISIDGSDITTNGDVTSATSSISIVAGNDATVNGALNTGTDVFVFANNDVLVSDITSGTSIDIYAGNNINSGGNVNASGPVFMQADNQLTSQNITTTDDISLDGENGVTVNGPLSGDEVNLSSGSAFVQLNNLVTAVTAVTIASDDDILNANLVGGLSTPALNLTSYSGDIGASGDYLNVDVTDLTANAGFGDVFVRAANGVNLADNAGGSSALNSFNIIATTGDITSTGTVSADTVNLTSELGAINLGADVTATTAANLLAETNITNVVGSAVTAPTITLDANTGSIGTDNSSRFTVDSDNLTLTASAGSVYVRDIFSTNIVSATALSTIDIVAFDDLSSSGAIAADVVSLEATGGGLTLAGSVTGTTSVSLKSDDSIVNASVTGGVFSPQIFLNSFSNSINLSSVDFTNLSAVAFGNITLVDTNGFNFGGADTSAGGDITVTITNGNLTSTDSVFSGGTLTFDVDGSATGGFDLDGTVTALTINLFSGATISDASISGGLFASNINLSSLNNINITTVDFTNVVANASGSVTLVDTTGNMNIGPGASSAGTFFTASAPVDLTSSGTVTAGTTASLTAVGGKLVLDAFVDAQTINLVSNDSILNSSIAGGLSTSGGAVNQLNLLSNNGDIGALGVGGALNINAVNLTANAPTANAFISDTAGGVNINGASGAFDVFVLNATGNITSTVAGTIDANAVNLTTTGGFFTLNGAVTGTSSIALTATTNLIIDANIAGGLNAPTLILTAQQIGVGSADRLDINTDNLIATATSGGIYVADADDLDVNSASATGSIDIVATGDLHSSGLISAGDDVTLRAVNGDFLLNGEVRAVDTITLRSFDSILNANIAGGLTGAGGTAAVANLVLTSDNGDIGAGLDTLKIDAVNLGANTPAGSVFITDDGHLGDDNINVNVASAAQDTFELTADNNLTSSASISGTTVFLNALGGSFTLAGSVQGLAEINLTSNGTINNAAVVGGLSSPQINLASSANNIDITSIDFAQVSALAANGYVNLADANDISIGADSSLSGTSFTVTAADSVTVAGAITAGTTLSLTATGGSINVNAPLEAVTIALSSNDSILDANVVGGLTADNFNFESTAGDISLSSLNLTNVIANAFGFVSLSDTTGSMTFNGASSAGTSFTAVAPVNLNSTAAGTISAVDVDLTATGGAFDLDGAVTGTTSIKLTSSASILDANVSGGLNSGIGIPAAFLDLTSTNGNIGDILDFLNVDADVLRANAATGTVFVEDANDITLGGGASGAGVAFGILSGGDITVNSNVTAPIVALTAGDDITLNADVTGSTGVSLNAGDALTETAGTVSGGLLTVDFGAASATLSTNVAQLTTVGDATDLTVLESDNIQLLSQVVDVLDVSSASGSITTGADLSLTALVLTSNTGNIDISNNITATGAVTFDTSTGNGSITQTAGTLITTPLLTMFSAAGGIGTGALPIRVNGTGAGAITVIAEAVGGDVNITYTGTNTISLDGSIGNNNFSVAALTGTIRTLDDIDGTGHLKLTTSNIIHSNTFDFDTIEVATAGSGSSLTISGTGGFFNSENGTTFDTLEGDMTFAGNTTFGGNGDAILTVKDLGGVNNFFTVNGGVSVVGQNQLTVNACDLILTGSLSGNPLVVNCADAGTIANNNGSGDVNLSGNIVFNGGPFAVVASGNINTSGATLIDLTGTTNGGNLTLMAGVTFTPTTPGQTQNADTYTITGFSTQGGNINLSTVNILTVGNNGNGGAVTAIANNGLTNAGNVSLGNIDTSGTATSGQVRIIGAGGVSTGDIDTTGGITSGNINIAVAKPVISGTIFVQNGAVTGGSFTTGAATNGNVLVGNITAPGRDVTILGALGAGDTISQRVGTSIASNKLIVNTGVGTATFASTSVGELNTSGGGAISLLNETDGIILNGVAGVGQDVVVNAGGTITVQGTGVNVDQLTLTGNSALGNAIVINAATTANDVDLISATGNIQLGAALTGNNTVDLNSNGAITQTAGTVSGNALSVSFGSGPVTLNTSVASLTTLSAGTLTINEANDITIGSQAVTALTVNSTAGNITTSADFLVNDLTLTATAGTIGITNDITATNSATLTASGGMTTTLGGSVITNNAVLSSAGAIGTDAANRFTIVANNMRVAAAQNAFVNNTLAGAVVLGNSIATNTLDIFAIGDLTGAGTASSANTVLATGGKFALTGALTGTTTLTLTANNNIVNADLTGTLTTPSLKLTSVTGSIGVDENNPFNVAAGIGTISGNALAATGSVFISSASTVGVNFAESTAGNDLSLASAGALTVTGDLTSVNGDLSVLGSGGFLTIGDNTTLTAFSSINIINTTSDKKAKLILGTGSTIVTNAKIAGLGDVTIALGPSILPPGGNKTPKFTTVVENGGTVSFSGRRAKGLSPQNIFTAQGADILVSNNLRNNLIEIRGGVTVTADPPVPVGTPVYISYGKGVMHGADATVSSPAVTTDSAFASELISSAPVASTAALQLVSLNNMTATNSLGSSNLLNAMSGDSASNLATVSTNGLAGAVSTTADNSYMTTNAPSSMNFDVQVCTDMELGFAAGANGVSTMPHSDCVTMDHGSVLFVASKDTTVVSPKGTVKLAAGAIALVVADATHLSVYDVNDHHKRSVEVEVGGRSIPLAPGRHVTVTSDKCAQFAEVNAIEAMMHRNVGHHDMGNGRKAFTTEFSLPGAIQVLKPLKALISSKHPEAQKVAAKVFKTSAIVMQLGQNGTSYEFHTKPKTVALNW